MLLGHCLLAKVAYFVVITNYLTTFLHVSITSRLFLCQISGISSNIFFNQTTAVLLTLPLCVFFFLISFIQSVDQTPYYNLRKD